MSEMAASRRHGPSWRPLGIVLVGVIGACGRGAQGPASEGESQPSAAVVTTQVVRGAVEETLEAFGTVEFDAAKVRTVTLVRSGQVVEVPVVVGQLIREGQPLLVLGPVPQDSLEAQKARIEVEYATRELARTRRLLDEKLATNQDVQNAEKELETAWAVLRGLGSDGSGAATVLKAPSDGVVAQVLLNRGQVVAAGHEAVQLAAPGALAVRVGFEVEDTPRLDVGLPVLLDPVYSGAKGLTVRAALSRLHRVVDPSTQLVEGLIQVVSPPAWMASGMRVRVRVVLRSRSASVLVPRDALIERDGKPGVFAVEQGRAHWKAVTLGIAGEQAIEVTDGLQVGETIVTGGRSSLADGMAVRTGEEPEHL